MAPLQPGTHKTFIQLNSGDFSVDKNSMNASTFRNTLSTPLTLDNNKQYEICVFDAWFPVRQDTNSVYINTNLVNQSIVGSQQTNTILWIPYTEITPAMNSNIYYTTSYARKWYPLSTKNIPYIDISITTSTGALIPVNSNDFSTITLAIREMF